MKENEKKIVTAETTIIMKEHAELTNQKKKKKNEDVERTKDEPQTFKQ